MLNLRKRLDLILEDFDERFEAGYNKMDMTMMNISKIRMIS